MPPPRGLKIDQRRKRILELVSRNGQVWVSELSTELEATPVTIRSDLSALEDEGLLERVSGGAVPRVRNILNSALFPRQNDDPDAKIRIACAAAKLVQNGETLFLNSGSTAYYTARELKFKKSLKIVTNSIPVALELGEVPSFLVYLLGGNINTQYSFTYGTNVLEQLKQFRADKTILSMDGISVSSGLTTYHAEEAVVNRVMMERAKETIIVAAQQKLGEESFSFVSDLTFISYLVTNESDVPAVDELKQSGLRIISA